MFGWNKKELEALREENQQLMKLLSAQERQKCEVELYTQKEGYVKDITGKFPTVGEQVIDAEYRKGKLLKFISDIDGHEKFRVVGVDQTEPKPVKKVFFPLKKKPTFFVEKKYNGKSREVVNRLREEGKSYSEISKATGIPRGSIGKLLKHSIKRKKLYVKSKKAKKIWKARKRVPLGKEAKLLNALKVGIKTMTDLMTETGFKQKEIHGIMYNLRKKGFLIRSDIKGKGGTRTARYDLLPKNLKEIPARTTIKKRDGCRWRKVAELANSGKSRSEIKTMLGLKDKQLWDSLWCAKHEKILTITPPPEKRHKKNSDAGTTPASTSPAPTAPTKAPAESEYMTQARKEDAYDLKELCAAIGVDFYHYGEVRSKIPFRSPYEYLLTQMLLTKSIRDREASEFLNIALKRAGLVLPEGLKNAICERAISFALLPNIHPLMKQKIPDELEKAGIVFNDVEDFLGDFILKPKIELKDWKLFIRNFGCELSEADFRNTFDFLGTIIAQFYKRNQYSVKINYSGYERTYFFRNWKRIKSGL